MKRIFSQVIGFTQMIAILISCLAVSPNAQGADTRWKLRIEDLKHKIRVQATIRLTRNIASESCMGGQWRRVIVENETTQDNTFFPLSEALAYEFKDGLLVLGRTQVCDEYLLLSGRNALKKINGTYKLLSIGSSKNLGAFSLVRIP